MKPISHVVLVPSKYQPFRYDVHATYSSHEEALEAADELADDGVDALIDEYRWEDYPWSSFRDLPQED